MAYGVRAERRNDRGMKNGTAQPFLRAALAEGGQPIPAVARPCERFHPRSRGENRGALPQRGARWSVPKRTDSLRVADAGLKAAGLSSERRDEDRGQ